MKTCSIRAILVGLLLAGCAPETTTVHTVEGQIHGDPDCVVQSPRVIPANPRFVAKTDHGILEMIGRGDEEIRLVTVWGTAYERGRAQGELLGDVISRHTGRLIELMGKGMKKPVELLDQVYAATKPHTPEHFMEELKGLADGSGVPLQQLIRANLIGEASEFHCSLYGAWGRATRADGHCYQLRCLDYAVRAEIQEYPTIVVHAPTEGQPFANIGWAGMVGCVTGISAAPLAISEIGDDYDEDNDSFDGTPFMYMLRDILQFDQTLAAALDRVRRTKRTSSLMYAIGDGKLGQVRALQTSRTLCNVYTPDDLEPVTQAHQRIPDVVYWGMSWNVPKYDGPLHDKLVEHYGHIDAKVTIEDILPYVRTGNLQVAVYDLTAMRIWVANARAKGEQGDLPAYDRSYVEIDMKQVFKEAIWRALGE
ncbi:MAG: hypothetical protein JXQ73_20935 [Phycisphaerae bacterium]|nr:hypothetical protein [Phycisphaerae bacterium]